MADSAKINNFAKMIVYSCGERAIGWGSLFSHFARDEHFTI